MPNFDAGDNGRGQLDAAVGGSAGAGDFWNKELLSIGGFKVTVGDVLLTAAGFTPLRTLARVAGGISLVSGLQDNVAAAALREHERIGLDTADAASRLLDEQEALRVIDNALRDMDEQEAIRVVDGVLRDLDEQEALAVLDSALERAKVEGNMDPAVLAGADEALRTMDELAALAIVDEALRARDEQIGLDVADEASRLLDEQEALAILDEALRARDEQIGLDVADEASRLLDEQEALATLDEALRARDEQIGLDFADEGSRFLDEMDALRTIDQSIINMEQVSVFGNENTFQFGQVNFGSEFTNSFGSAAEQYGIGGGIDLGFDLTSLFGNAAAFSPYDHGQQQVIGFNVDPAGTERDNNTPSWTPGGSGGW